MESLVLIAKCASFALACKQFVQNKKIAELENNYRNELQNSVDKLNARIEAYHDSPLYTAIDLLKNAQYVDDMSVNFYLDNSYINFTQSYHSYNNTWRSFFKIDSIQEAIVLIQALDDKTSVRVKEIERVEPLLKVSLYGCFLCSFFKQDYRVSLVYLDRLLSMEMGFVAWCTLIKISRLCKDDNYETFPYFPRNISPDIHVTDHDESLSIIKTIFEIASNKNILIDKELNKVCLLYLKYDPFFCRLDIEKFCNRCPQDSKYYNDLKYIIEKKEIVKFD